MTIIHQLQIFILKLHLMSAICILISLITTSLISQLKISTSTPNTNDVLIWFYYINGIYTIKSGYSLIFHNKKDLYDPNMEP